LTNLKSQIIELTEKNNLLQKELNEYKATLGDNIKEILNNMKDKIHKNTNLNEHHSNQYQLIVEEARSLLRVSKNEEVIPAIKIGLNYSLKEEVSPLKIRLM
jgi:hypothetical protein